MRTARSGLRRRDGYSRHRLRRPRARALLVARGLVGRDEGLLCARATPESPRWRSASTSASTISTALVAFARERGVGLVVVGPELPLTLGLVDRLRAAGVKAFGPTAAAARLEGSKAFTKAFCARHGIPTAAFRTFTREEAAAAEAYVEQHTLPVVVKADGLAAGKGLWSPRPPMRR